MKSSRPSLKPEENPPSRIQLIIFDVDGTLLDSDSELRAGVRMSIRTALDDGMQLSLASGRNKTQIDNLAMELGMPGPVISLGGASLGFAGLAPPLRHLVIPHHRAQRLVVESRELGLGIMIQTFTDNLLESDDETADVIDRIASGNFTRTGDILATLAEPASKITLIGPGDTISSMQSLLDDELDPLYSALSGERFLDITSSGADKGTSVQHLIQYLGFDPSVVVAIGDGHNDISMFDEVGTSIAMGNALEDVKQAADLVAPSNDGDGAAWAIKEILKLNASA